LLENGADINATDAFQETPLHFANWTGHPETAQLLENAAKQQSHAGRVTEERKDKGPPQVGG
jgi:ankyrin repeat protein